ncbi:MAG: ATP-dependent helicase [Bacteroidales bacterium]|nr:ATP-dependent helicase [Bacteroidales bacterium]
MINTQDLYKEINTLEKSIFPNEAKANDLRKLFEKLLHQKLDTDASEKHISLNDLIDNYVKLKQKYDLQYIFHRLRKDLNPWSHHTEEKLTNLNLEDYITRLKNIVRLITGESDQNNKNMIKPFTLNDLTLNKKQKKAVLSKSKITLVNAGPGTGKTHLIVGRILEEINKNHEKKIFGLSFTNKASDELQHKTDNKIFSTNLVLLRDNISTGTIHSFALNFIQQYFEFKGRVFDYIVIDEAELKDIKDEFGNDAESIEKHLTENKILTFDKIISMFINRMKNNVNFQNFMFGKLDEIIVDEAQDLDKEQYEILSLLYVHIKDLKLFFVGDQRQNIYAFKGGSLNNILEYFKDENDFSIVELDHSYRCPQNILSFVNHIKFDDCKNIQLANAVGNEGKRLTIEEFTDKEDEANWIAKLIKQKKDDGVKLNEIAIIWSNTFYFREILEALNAYGISFKVFGGQYFINPHIRLLRLVLNLISTNNNYALKAIQTFMIDEELEGKDIREVMMQLAGMDPSKYKNHRNLYHILKFIKEKQTAEQTPLDVVSDFITFMNKEKIFDDKILELYYSFKMIIENDLTLDNYDKLKLAFTPNHPEFAQFYSRSDEIVSCENEDDSNFVTVTTVHSAKGLEWDHVIIPGMAQDSFPRWFPNEDERKKELPNEMKKFYVACTRSKENLYLTRPKSVTIKSKKNGQYYTFERGISKFIYRLK